MALRLLEHTANSLASVFAERYGKGPLLAYALYREFFQNLNPRAWRTAVLAAAPGLAERLGREMVFEPGAVVSEVCQEGVVKTVTELVDGERIESVFLPMATHGTICVSSQAGCRMGCRFCETGRLGWRRQLSVAEIVGQVYQARQRFGAAVRNVVFMGMGEPMDNLEAVIQAIRVLSDQRGLDIAQRYITISTAGRVDGIDTLAALGMPHLKLAVSLNAPNDALRSQWMPVNRTAPLDRLRKALMAYPLKKGYAIMIAYVLIPGMNDSPECARELADWLRPLTAKVNLIPFNPGKAACRPPSDVELEAFRQRLIGLGVNVQKRTPRGRELMAACGQLGGARLASGHDLGRAVARLPGERRPGWAQGRVFDRSQRGERCMIDIIKRLLGGAPEDRKAVDSSRRHDLKVATCALLVEMGRIDETFTKREIDTIIDILESRYGLSSEDAEALMAEADKALEESVDLWQFARLINENYSRQEKIGIIETLWQVVFVDGKMDQYEDYLMHKMATLLRLHHKELMDAKLKILHGPASQPSQGAN